MSTLFDNDSFIAIPINIVDKIPPLSWIMKYTRYIRTKKVELAFYSTDYESNFYTLLLFMKIKIKNFNKNEWFDRPFDLYLNYPVTIILQKRNEDEFFKVIIHPNMFESDKTMTEKRIHFRSTLDNTRKMFIEYNKLILQ